MHLAIIGLGALGRVYGARLAARTACAVSFVVRDVAAARAKGSVRLSRIDGDGAVEVLASPEINGAVPAHADVVLVAVRVEQLDAALDRLLVAVPDIPLLVVTPLLPADLARLTATHGPRLRPVMPGVVAYVTPDGTCRYWLPKVAPTLIDARPPVPETVTDLAGHLEAAGFATRLELGVHETNPAATLSFIPLAMGVDAAGGIDALLGDRALLSLSLGAVQEGLALAAKVGRAPPWVGVLAKFAGPMALKMGVSLARSRSREAFAYVEDHFGRKLHAQNVAMARAMVDLADEKGARADSLRALLERLESALPLAPLTAAP